MIADGCGYFAEAIGLTQDLTEGGMGVRSQRYAMIVDDGVIKTLKVDAPGKYEVTDPDTILAALR